MNRNRLVRKPLATALAAAVVGFTAGAFFAAIDSGPLRPAFAQEHEGGKGGSGGHESGGGHDSGGGHEGGKGGKGGMGGGEASGEHAMHGTKAGHAGHASGVHGEGGVAHGKQSNASATVGPRRFGGGSGVATLDAVPEGPGQAGRSYGPGPQYQLRYWGGWTVPEDVSVYATLLTTTDVVPLGSGGGGGAGLGLSLVTQGRCEGIGAKMTASNRISGRNLARINSAQAMVVPAGVKPETIAPFLLANLQEELEKPAPDLQLAGVYLGTAAAQPVTPQVVKQVGGALCVAIGDAPAATIATAAEEQRVGKSTLSVARGGKR